MNDKRLGKFANQFYNVYWLGARRSVLDGLLSDAEDVVHVLVPPDGKDHVVSAVSIHDVVNEAAEFPTVELTFPDGRTFVGLANACQAYLALIRSPLMQSMRVRLMIFDSPRKRGDKVLRRLAVAMEVVS